MKKTYETPSVEKVTFQYRNQVVATSGGINSHTCEVKNTHAASVTMCSEVSEVVRASEMM